MSLRLLAVGLIMIATVFLITDSENWWRYVLSAGLLWLIIWMAMQYGKVGGRNLPM